jgi:uncharacterized protein (DUF433 family)
MDRIEVNAAICSGKPVIRGTRIMVSNILGMVAGGYSVDRILTAFPDLSREDVSAALEYAAKVVDESRSFRVEPDGHPRDYAPAIVAGW